jgi:hypothetical protein
MNYEISFLISLVLTVVIETLVLWILLKTAEKKKKIPAYLLLITGFFASFATLPYLWFIIPVFIHERVLYIIISEFLAILFESFILFGFLKINYPKCAFFSAVCNIVSFSAGWFISYAWPGLL